MDLLTVSFFYGSNKKGLSSEKDSVIPDANPNHSTTTTNFTKTTPNKFTTQDDENINLDSSKKKRLRSISGSSTYNNNNKVKRNKRAKDEFNNQNNKTFSETKNLKEKLGTKNSVNNTESLLSSDHTEFHNNDKNDQRFSNSDNDEPIGLDISLVDGSSTPSSKENRKFFRHLTNCPSSEPRRRQYKAFGSVSKRVLKSSACQLFQRILKSQPSLCESRTGDNNPNRGECEEKKSVGIQEKSVGIHEKSVGIHEKSVGFQEECVGIQEKSVGIHEKSVGFQEECVGNKVNFENCVVSKNDVADETGEKVSKLQITKEDENVDILSARNLIEKSIDKKTPDELGRDDDDAAADLSSVRDSGDNCASSTQASEKQPIGRNLVQPKIFTHLKLKEGSSIPSSEPDGGGSSFSSPKQAKRKLDHFPIFRGKEKSQQLVLDFGQKVKGPVQCDVCGLIYNPSQKDDKIFHADHHKNFLLTLKYTISGKDRVLQVLSGGDSIVLILDSDKTGKTKVEEIKRHIDSDLGFVVDSKSSEQFKAFLYVKNGYVVGFCLVHVIKQAFRMISHDVDGSVEKEVEDTGNVNGLRVKSQRLPYLCSTTPEVARCGINRIWVSLAERRKRVATKLLDAVRGHFSLGSPLAKSDLAFSDPTPNGVALATSYAGTENFLVYRE